MLEEVWLREERNQSFAGDKQQGAQRMFSRRANGHFILNEFFKYKGKTLSS